MGLKGVNQRLINSLERWVRSKWRLQDEAEDVVAESLANAVARAESIEVHNPDVYMRSAIRNELGDLHRKREVRERAADKLSIEAEPACSGMEMACMNEDLLTKILQELQEDEREVLLLKFCDGLTLAEIAQQLGKSYSSVQRLFKQAMAGCMAIAARLQGDEK